MNALSAPRQRRGFTIATALVAILTLAITVQPVALPAADAAPTRTTVSLTFDDGDANQLTALPILQANNMKATFFIPSGYVGAANYMTLANLNTLKAAGHEIGGHTVNHPDLATIPIAEAKRQICTDRRTLTSWGFSVRSFAYPFASSTPEVENAVRDCGYRSARGLGDITSPYGCEGCAYAETVPPASPFQTRALMQFEPNWTLANLKQAVLNAEANGGGWVQYTFHDVCDSGCGELSISPGLLSQFLQWLKPRASSKNTVVKTVGDTVGGSARPVVDAPSVPPAAAGVNAVSNPGYETLAATGDPSCWMRGGWGTNTPTFSFGTPAHSGSRASVVTMAGYTDGDAKLVPQFDLGSCSPTVQVGHTYSLRSWYQSTVPSQFAVYLRDSTGTWFYWTSSPWVAASSTWAQAEWTTPAIPAGYSALSFGLNIFSNGTLRTDDVAMYDTVGAPSLTAAMEVATPGAVNRSAIQSPDGPVEVANQTEEVMADQIEAE